MRTQFLVACLSLTLTVAAAQVDTAWVRFYNPLPNGWSGAFDLAVDAAGNVYVTGASYGGASELDFATIKYSPSGDTLWVRRYDGAAHGDDESYALALDDSGNVCVTGGSADSSGSWDCLTIKYGPDGDTLWVARYDGPGHDDDWANDVEIDRAGSVYITGTSITEWPNFDIVTIKYSSAGVQQWVSRHGGAAGLEDEANAVAVDDQSNVYVTGIENRGARPDTVSNMVTIKYAPSGDTLWVRRFSGTVDDLDQGYDIAVDGVHNVYVTGTVSEILSKCITIKYGPNGDTLWVRRYYGNMFGLEQNGFALTLDNSNNVYVGGRVASDTSWLDYLTIKYNSAGDTLWVRTYNGPCLHNSADWVNDIAIDEAGNVYVTGTSSQDHPPNGELDYATVKYSANGEQEWVAVYNHPANEHDEAFAVAVDDAGYVYVTGVCGDGSYATIKYTQAGAVVEETPNSELRSMNSSQTIVRGVLFLPAKSEARMARGELLDISGRRVMDLQPGANDISHLAPGVYVVQVERVSEGRRIVVVNPERKGRFRDGQ